MILTATIRNEENPMLGVLTLKPKTFSSGRVGWHGQTKLELDGDRYQTQCQLVKIGEPEERRP